MSHWNHRVVRVQGADGNITFGVHEVYYDDAGVPWSMTSEPITFDVDVNTLTLSEDQERDAIIDLKALVLSMQRALGMPVLDAMTAFTGKSPGEEAGGEKPVAWTSGLSFDGMPVDDGKGEKA